MDIRGEAALVTGASAGLGKETARVLAQRGARVVMVARGQAALGRTYHQDRYRGPLERDASGAFATITWEQATAKLGSAVSAAGRRVAAVLSVVVIIDQFGELL